MSDEDRQAFEVKHRHLDLTLDKDAWAKPIYRHTHVQAMYDGWQAARALYAPKITQRVAVDFAAKSIAIADCGKWDSLEEGDERDVHRGVTCKLYYRYLASAAFRAAGIRFKDCPNDN